MHKIKNSVFKGSIVILVMTFILPFLFASDTSAATLTLSLDSSSLSLLTTPTSSDGTFASSSNLGISVTLNGLGGYLLSIRASSSAASARTLINSTANTALTSITSAVSPTNYADNTYALANNLNNTWGYLPSKFNSAANTDFHPAPTANGDVIDETSEAGNNTAVNYTISIGARVDTTTKPGTYSNTFVIVAVANRPDCNPTTTTIDTAVCMQDINDRVINSMEPEVQYQLYDNRDYKKYYVAKMKDGRVWMTQNLDLDLVSDTKANNYVALTSLNTDLNTYGSQNYTATNNYSCSNASETCAGGIITWVPAATAATTTAEAWTPSNNVPYSFDRGEYYYYINSSGSATSYSTRVACEAAHNDGTCPHYHSGNYYNFTASVASNNTNTLNSVTMGNSICPKGWRLPQSKTSDTTTDGGYYSEVNLTLVSQNILTNYVSAFGASGKYATNGYTNLSSAPMYFSRTGYKNGTTITNGASIYYRTNKTNSADYAYGFYFQSNAAYPYYASTYSTRSYGMPVRCIARQANTGSTEITYDKNASDATGTVNSQTIDANKFGTITNNAFSRSGYAFNSWNTRPDGSGTTYNEGDSYYAIAGTAATNVTLYAQWDKTYTITFKTADANTTGIYFDGVKYTNNQTTQAVEGRDYTIGGEYATKYGFYSWTITAGSLANSSNPSTVFTAPSSNATITLASQEATVDMSSLPVSTDPVSSDCKNQTPTPTLVYDPRDNEAYYVARLCDGNYWMLDNLRLDLTDSTVINSLSESNTNASNTALGYLKNGGGTASDKYAITGLSGSNWNSSSYSFSEPRVNVGGNAVADNGSGWVGSYTKDTVASTTYGQGLGKVGVYYNYCAASAGTFCYGDGSSGTGTPTTDPNTTVAPTARDIEGDICPKGWRMPTGGEYNSVTGGGELQNLYNQYADATSGQIVAFRNALSTAFSGSYYSGSVHGHGTSTDIWSSTWYREQYNYDMVVGTANALPIIMTSVISGVSVRCMRYDPVSVTVNFANGVESVTLKKEDGPAQTVTTSGSTVTLERNKTYYVSIISSARYAVTGWSATGGDPTSSARGVASYTPSGDATITITSQQATTDIATVSASGTTPNNNCKNEAITPQLVYDSRDNEAYWVAELCDGKVWMLDNLRLDLSKALPSYSGTDKITLSTSNTNASAQAISCLLTGSYDGNTCTGSFSTAAVQTKTLSGGSWTNSYNLPYIATSGTCANASYCAHDPSTNQWTADSISPIAYGPGSGKIGVYYNYCAASAGSYCYASNAGVDVADTWRDIESDICPAGWRLPTGNTNSGTTRITDYGTLYAAYSGATIGQAAALRNALSTPLSGYFVNSSAYNQGSYSYFWSSTWNSTSSMYTLYVVSSAVVPSSGYSRLYGTSVRCVLGS